MSAETVVGLVRNGLCVLADLAPATTVVHQNATFVAAYYGDAPTPSFLNVAIAALQFVAAFYNVVGAVKLLGLVAAFKAAADKRRRASKARRDLATIVAASAWEAVFVDAAVGLLRLVFGPTFFVLVLYSLKLVGDPFLHAALLLMQIALVFALGAMASDCARHVTAATLARVARRSKSPLEVLLSLKYCGYGLEKAVGGADKKTTFVLKKDGGAPLDEVLFADGATADDLSARADALETAVKGKLPADLNAALDKAALEEDTESMLAIIYFLLNLAAFGGYNVFPMSYYMNFWADASIMWLGNFVGDLAWTIAAAPVGYRKIAVKVTIAIAITLVMESLHLGFLFGTALLVAPY